MRRVSLEDLREAARECRVECSEFAPYLVSEAGRREVAEWLADQILAAAHDDRLTNELLEAQATREQIIGAVMAGFEDAGRTLH